MKQLIVNIKHAIHNNEVVNIGGGDFDRIDLHKIVMLYEAAKQAKETLTWLHGGEPLPTMEIDALNRLKEVLMD